MTIMTNSQRQNTDTVLDLEVSGVLSCSAQVHLTDLFQHFMELIRGLLYHEVPAHMESMRILHIVDLIVLHECDADMGVSNGFEYFEVPILGNDHQGPTTGDNISRTDSL